MATERNEQDIVNVGMTRAEWRSVLRAIASRQKDCQNVTDEFPNYDKFQELDARLERLKMGIAGQI